MYNKLFTKILDSSIWLEPIHTRLVWMTLIAAMDEDGFAQFASVANLAHRARIDEPETQEAINCLTSPDPNSSDPEFEGRRIERVPGGWVVLNAEKYRDIVTRAIAKEKTRLRVARFREGKKSVTNGNGVVTEEKRPVTPSDTETDTPTKTGYTVPLCFEKVEGFTAALAGWIEHRRLIKKPVTKRAIQMVIDKCAERPEDAVMALNLVVESGWNSFQWSWIEKHKNDKPSSTLQTSRPPAPMEPTEEERALAAQFGKTE